MAWLQLSLDAGESDADALAAFFEAQGALSVTFADAADQPLFEPEPGTTPTSSRPPRACRRSSARATPGCR